MPLRARGLRRATLADRVFAVAVVALVLASLMKIAVGNPLASVGGPQSVYELGLLGASTVLLLVGLNGRMPPLALFFEGPILAVLLYALLATASALWSPSPMLSLGKGIELLVLLLNAVLLAVKVRDSGLVAEIPSLVAIATLVVAGVFLAVNQVLWGTPFPTGTGNMGRRLMLAYTHPLAVAGLVALGFLAALTSTMRRGWRLLCLFLFAWLLYQSGARGSTAGTVVAALMFLAARRRGPLRSAFHVRTLRSALAGALVVGLLIVLLSRPEIRQALLAVMPDAATLNGRILLWKAVLDQVGESPVLGHGYYASRFILLDVFTWGGHSHQVLLEILLTTGLIGLLLFVWFVLATLPLAMRHLFLFTYGVYLAFASFVGPVLFQVDVAMHVLVLVIAGLLLDEDAVRARLPSLPPPLVLPQARLAGRERQ